MKLYEVTNGFTGFSYVRVLIVASDEKSALELARKEYEKESKGYKESYYTNLTAELLCDDTSKDWTWEVTD